MTLYYPITDQEALLAAIVANPKDDAPWLVYSDWLEEHGEPEAAESAREKRMIVDELETRAARWLHRVVSINRKKWDHLGRFMGQVDLEEWRIIWRNVWLRRDRVTDEVADLLSHARRILKYVFREKLR